jgi:hypothetical protein
MTILRNSVVFGTIGLLLALSHAQALGSQLELANASLVFSEYI